MTTTNPSTTSLAELTDVYEREGLLGIQALLSRKEEEVVDGIYKFPAWFDEKLKSEFYDMWKCFNRTPWDYFMQGMGYQAKNGRRVVARKLMTEQIIVGEYFHKSSNIGWVFDGNEVHHVFNAELSETAKEHCKTCLKDKEILPGSWHSWPTIEHPNPLPNPTHASPDSTKKCPLEECDRDANHRGIHLPDKGVSQGKESSEEETLVYEDANPNERKWWEGGSKQERSRILALLESKKKECDQCENREVHDTEWNQALTSLAEEIQECCNRAPAEPHTHSDELQKAHKTEKEKAWSNTINYKNCE